MKIEATIVVGEEDRLTVIAALRHMMGYTRDDDARATGHKLGVGGGGLGSQGKCVCPL
jgi:hypothetical protein